MAAGRVRESQGLPASDPPFSTVTNGGRTSSTASPGPQGGRELLGAVDAPATSLREAPTESLSPLSLSSVASDVGP